MAYGFKKARSQSGAPSSGLMTFKVADNYGTALFAGDPVRLENGYLVRAATTERVDGIFMGASWVNSDGEIKTSRHLPANTTSSGTADGQLTTPEARVAPVEGNTFIAEADDSIAAANIGDLFAFAAGSGGDTVGGNSSFVVDASTAADVATAADVRVLGFVEKSGNSGSSTPEVEVQFLRTPLNIV